jgi:hypothetical protein
MPRLETDTGSIQDDLPADVLRKLQVEELWARRNVLADLINAERLTLYASKRALRWPELLKAQVVVKDYSPATRISSIVPIRVRKPHPSYHLPRPTDFLDA